jgi:DNA-binding response OmpR family regulator
MSSTSPDPQPRLPQAVLIIDDDPSVRAALGKLLEETGCRVTMAADGRRGLELLRQQQFHLLVLDLDLPKVSGWDILDFAGAHWPLMPVLVLTGFSSQCAPGSLSGADAFLEKPPEVARLLNTISFLLNEPLEARLRRRCDGSAQPAGSAIRSGTHLATFFTKPVCG